MPFAISCFSLYGNACVFSSSKPSSLCFVLFFFFFFFFGGGGWGGHLYLPNYHPLKISRYVPGNKTKQLRAMANSTDLFATLDPLAFYRGNTVLYVIVLITLLYTSCYKNGNINTCISVKGHFESPTLRQ